MSMSEVELAGRTVVVTGASRGIGASIAEVCAGQGMNLGLCARTEPVLADHGQVVARSVDVTDEAGVEAFAKEVEDRFGAIDLWINNAGVLSPIAKLRDVDVADFRSHIDINLTGVFIGTRTYIRHRRVHEGGGVLINISSGAAWNAYAGWGAYCAGKAGIALLSEVAAIEESDSGLRVHAIAPGVVDTDMQAQIRDCSSDRFPDVQNFLDLKRDDNFNSGEYVARELLAIAFDPARRIEEVNHRLEYE
jgi:NAD(P)-dependent dehydrogenase (short-subunit alcohol dehydrogenase family)